VTQPSSFLGNGESGECAGEPDLLRGEGGRYKVCPARRFCHPCFFKVGRGALSKEMVTVFEDRRGNE
jgi:hypothetical protein